jgi:hypothetical protein
MNIFKNFFFKVKKYIFKKSKPTMEAEILVAMKRIKFIEAEARRRLLEEEKKKESSKLPKPMIKKNIDDDYKTPKKVSNPEVKKTKEIAETPKNLKVESIKNPIVSKKKQTIPHHIKTLVWNVHIGEKVAEAKCLCCKVTSISIRHFHCGHYISEKNGGDLTVTNLRPICANCNLSMGAMNMDEFIKKFGLHK